MKSEIEKLQATIDKQAARIVELEDIVAEALADKIHQDNVIAGKNKLLDGIAAGEVSSRENNTQDIVIVKGKQPNCEKWGASAPIDMVHGEAGCVPQSYNKNLLKELKEKYPDTPTFLLPLKAKE